MININCTPDQLAAICTEADRPHFSTASELTPHTFAGGFDHATPADNGWGITLFDRGCNGRVTHLRFQVPAAARTGRQGPAK